MGLWSRLRRFLCGFLQRESASKGISERNFVEALGGKWTGKWTTDSLMLLQNRRGKWRMSPETWAELKCPPKIYGFGVVIDNRVRMRTGRIEFCDLP